SAIELAQLGAHGRCELQRVAACSKQQVRGFAFILRVRHINLHGFVGSETILNDIANHTDNGPIGLRLVSEVAGRRNLNFLPDRLQVSKKLSREEFVDQDYAGMRSVVGVVEQTPFPQRNAQRGEITGAHHIAIRHGTLTGEKRAVLDVDSYGVKVAGI